MGIHTRLLTATLAIALLGLPASAGPATAQRGTDPSVGSISVSVAHPAVLVGQPIVFRGVVKPRRAGLPVRLQRKVGSGWKSLSTTRTTSRGRYRLASTVEFGGAYQFRVIRLPWLTNSVRSRTVRVTAYVWNDVNSMVQPGDYDGGVSFDEDADIDGTTYPNSTVIDADSLGTTEGGYFEVGLEGLNCAVLDVVVGALDGNAPNSEVGAEVSLDGEVVAEGTYNLGESERLTLDVRGASRLRVEGSVVVEGLFGRLGLGTPRLLCAS